MFDFLPGTKLIPVMEQSRILDSKVSLSSRVAHRQFTTYQSLTGYLHHLPGRHLDEDEDRFAISLEMERDRDYRNGIPTYGENPTKTDGVA
jgi:hypothetical protein